MLIKPIKSKTTSIADKQFLWVKVKEKHKNTAWSRAHTHIHTLQQSNRYIGSMSRLKQEAIVRAAIVVRSH